MQAHLTRMGQTADKQLNENMIEQVGDSFIKDLLDFRLNNSSNDTEDVWGIFPKEEWFRILRDKQNEVRNVPYTTELILIIVYSVLISFGLITNLLVSFVVARRRQMHTARNLYIVNLTVSDISMCFICMPFTLVMILRRQWTMGPLLCKLVHVLQGTNIMVSVGTITVIALDRYFTICKNTTENVSSTRRRVVISIALIWLISLLASMPLFFYQGLEPVSVHELVLYEACIEHWPSQQVRVLYDTGVLLVMAVIPPLVVAIVHARIAKYLNAHTRNQKDSARARREIERNRRTTMLLSGIVIIFVVSWLPLGIFSLLADLVFIYDSDSYGESSPHRMYTALAIVHICAMTSAISNPIVYGWLNSNIRREFIELLPKACASRWKSSSTMKATTVENETMRTQVNCPTNTLDGRKESIALLVCTNVKSEGQNQNFTNL